MSKKLYVFTNKHQKKLMQKIMDRMNETTYLRYQCELALYGYVDFDKFMKKYPIDSLVVPQKPTNQI